MRIAVCLSGQPRSVRACVASLRGNLLGGRDCDFFVHTWHDSALEPVASFREFVRDESAWTRITRLGKLLRRYRKHREKCRRIGSSFPVARREIEELLVTAYAPRGLAIEQQEVFDLGAFDRDDQNVTLRRHETNPQHVLSMFRSIARANALKSEHERAHGFRYDCVVRCRTDLYFFEPFDLDAHRDAMAGAVVVPAGADFRGGLNDQLAFSTSANMDVYARAFDSIAAHYARGGLFHAETILRAHLESSGLPVARAAIDYRIIRGGVPELEQVLAERSAARAAATTGP